MSVYCIYAVFNLRQRYYNAIAFQKKRDNNLNMYKAKACILFYNSIQVIYVVVLFDNVICFIL